VDSLVDDFAAAAVDCCCVGLMMMVWRGRRRLLLIWKMSTIIAKLLLRKEASFWKNYEGKQHVRCEDPASKQLNDGNIVMNCESSGKYCRAGCSWFVLQGWVS